MLLTASGTLSCHIGKLSKACLSAVFLEGVERKFLIDWH
jgi:hypothetical protein